MEYLNKSKYFQIQCRGFLVFTWLPSLLSIPGFSQAYISMWCTLSWLAAGSNPTMLYKSWSSGILQIRQNLSMNEPQSLNSMSLIRTSLPCKGTFPQNWRSWCWACAPETWTLRIRTPRRSRWCQRKAATETSLLKTNVCINKSDS